MPLALLCQYVKGRLGNFAPIKAAGSSFSLDRVELELLLYDMDVEKAELISEGFEGSSIIGRRST